MTPDLLSKIQKKLDAGLSHYRIAKDFNISNSSIANHIAKGTLKKPKAETLTGDSSTSWNSTP